MKYLRLILIQALIIFSLESKAVGVSPASHSFLRIENRTDNANAHASSTGLSIVDSSYTIESYVHFPDNNSSTRTNFFIFRKEGLGWLSFKEEGTFFDKRFVFEVNAATDDPLLYNLLIFRIDQDELLNTGHWHHIAAIFDFDRNNNVHIALYLDGKIALPSSFGTSYFIEGNEPHEDEIGIGLLEQFGNLDTAVYLDDLRLSNIKRYSQNFTPPLKALVTDINTIALWNFDGPVGTMNYMDSSPNNNDLTGTDGTLIISLDDTDEDGIEDSMDNCPTIKNNSQVDTDNDGTGDVCDAFPLDKNETTDTDNDGVGNNADTDDDSDGMPDKWEIEYGLNPLDPNDALFDNDGDGLTNLDEYKANRDPLVSDDASAIKQILPIILHFLD